MVSRLGIGDVADRAVPIEQCVATVRRAMDAGLNLIDTAPAYEQGYSEEIVGRALQGRREGMFVVDKIDHHDAPVAPQVEGSLARLGLDEVDLFLFHSVSDVARWEAITAPGAGMDQLDVCRQAGKVRFRGISSHHPDVLARAIPSGLCDVVLFPVSAAGDPRYVSEILPLARRHGVGTMGMKAFGAGKLLGDTTGYGAALAERPLKQRPRGKFSSGGVNETAVTTAEMPAPELPRLTPAECLHYMLTCDPDVALLGLSFPNEQDAAFAAAQNFTALSDKRMAELVRRAAEAIEGKGNCWWNPA